MGLHQLLGDVQAQAQAGHALAVAHAHELLEHAAAILGCDAHALVADADRGGARQLGQFHPDRLAGAIAQGIRQQVHDDLLEAELVPVADQVDAIGLERDRHVAALALHFGDHALEHRGEVAAAAPDRQLAVLDLRDVEHVVDQSREAAHLALVALEHPRQVLRQEEGGVARGDLVLAHADLHREHAQRRAQLVHHHRHEFVAHLQRAPQVDLRRLQLRDQGLLSPARFLQRDELAPQLRALAIQVDEDLHLALDRIGVERLVEEVDRSVLVALERVVELLAGGADENDRQVLGARHAADQLRELEAVHAGHLDVEDRQRELVFEQQRQRLLAGGSLVDAVAVVPDRGLQGQQVLGEIVDDQELDARVYRHRFSPSLRSKEWISASGRIRSGAMARMAASGIVGTSAVAGSWTMVSAPATRMPARPAAPS